MTPAATQRALDRFGPVFVQLYGQGETPMTATVLRRQDHRPDTLGSAGRARPGVDVRIMNENGELAPPDTVGEVVVRGPSVMSGYWNRPEASAETLATAGSTPATSGASPTTVCSTSSTAPRT